MIHIIRKKRIILYLLLYYIYFILAREIFIVCILVARLFILVLPCLCISLSVTVENHIIFVINIMSLKIPELFRVCGVINIIFLKTGNVILYNIPANATKCIL